MDFFSKRELEERVKFILPRTDVLPAASVQPHDLQFCGENVTVISIS